MEIYKSKYIIRRFDANRNIMYSTWLSNTEGMRTDEFKAEMLNLPAHIGQYGAKFLLSNLQNLRFPIDPTLQLWIAETISPKFAEMGLRKQAMVLPEEFISQIALQQTIEEVEHADHEHQSRFFSSEADAEKWLV